MKYAVKIELEKAATKDYQVLHNAMVSKNFYQYVKSDNYEYEGRQNKMQILQNIQDAVEKTGRAAQVQIIELKNWLGFEKASNPISATICI